MQTTFTPTDVTIRDVTTTPVAIMQHRGDPATIGATIQRFIAWRKANGLSRRTSPTFNVFHSDPRTTPSDEYRLDLCVGTDRALEANGERIQAGTIPGGRCAPLATLIMWSVPRFTSTRLAAGQRRGSEGLSPSTANASPSSRKYQSMRPSRSCFCR